MAKAPSELSPPPPPTFTIRRATPSDAPSIAAMGASIFASTFGYSLSPTDLTAYLTTAYSPASITADLADPAKDTFIACPLPPSTSPSTNPILGFTLLTQGTSAAEPCVAHALRPVELQRLYVDPASQGRGVGKALVEVVEEVARAKGFQTLWLGVWEENVRAQKAYGRMGFEKIGNHGFRMGECVQTDWIMKKEI